MLWIFTCFTDLTLQEKFWKRTGYSLHNYKENYDKLPTAPASDLHSKRDRKRFETGYVDANDARILAWKKQHPMILDEDFPEVTGTYGRTRRGLLFSTMNYLIRQYLQCKPREQAMEHQALMHSANELYNGALHDVKKLQLRQLLISRLQMNGQTSQPVCEDLRNASAPE